MPQTKIEIDPRKVNFLGHFHPDDRATVIAWTFAKLRREPELTAEELTEQLKKQVHTHHVKDFYPYLRERVLFIFEARRHVIVDWCEWCKEWHALTPEDKKAARVRFEAKQELWTRR